jgi:hypothetical protein
LRNRQKRCSSPRLTGATLAIAKLDRLSRNAAFLLTLRDSGVRFVAANMPETHDLTVGIMALVAQQEREAIARRTKEALQAARARGTKLGNPNGAAELRRAGRAQSRYGGLSRTTPIGLPRRSHRCLLRSAVKATPPCVLSPGSSTGAASGREGADAGRSQTSEIFCGARIQTKRNDAPDYVLRETSVHAMLSTEYYHYCSKTQ